MPCSALQHSAMRRQSPCCAQARYDRARRPRTGPARGSPPPPQCSSPELLLHHLEQPLHPLAVQPRRRLVQKQQRGLVDQSARASAMALPLATGHGSLRALRRRHRIRTRSRLRSQAWVGIEPLQACSESSRCRVRSGRHRPTTRGTPSRSRRAHQLPGRRPRGGVLTEPLVGLRMVLTMRKSAVLPDPLGPSIRSTGWFAARRRYAAQELRWPRRSSLPPDGDAFDAAASGSRFALAFIVVLVALARRRLGVCWEMRVNEVVGAGFTSARPSAVDQGTCGRG